MDLNALDVSSKDPEEATSPAFVIKERSTAANTALNTPGVSSKDPEEATSPTFVIKVQSTAANTALNTPGVSSEKPKEATSPSVVTTEESATDCYDLWRQGNTASGEYTVAPPGWNGGAFAVNCNNSIDGGGWTIIQRRMFIPSIESFDRDWDTYKHGFGNLSRGYWLGNEKLAFLTNQKRYELRIDLVNQPLNAYHAKYDFFRISGESDNYRMVGLGNYTGTAGFDEMQAYRNLSFTTYDRDNDLNPGGNCAELKNGGWWYYECYWVYAWLNEGHWYKIGYWWRLPDDPDLMYSEMKIRPVQ